ncbi:hypothetical protein QBA54_09675 [Streptomyces sp. B21-108]|uniref:hypothetical protein n=1 Tax=Streptomyces sp. B21-108 TaxID=3039419 RepID=UPI002FEFB315
MRVFAGLGLAGAIADHTMPYRPSEYRNADGRVIKRIGAAPPPHLLGWAPNYVFDQPSWKAPCADDSSGRTASTCTSARR